MQCIFEQSNSTQPLLSLLKPSPPTQEKLEKTYAGIFAAMQKEIGSCPSVHVWMKQEYGTPQKRQDLALSLCDLETKCRGCLGLGPASNLLDQVPRQTVRDGTPVRFKVHLSKFGFLEDSQLKGPVNSFAVSLSCNHYFINVLSTFYQLFINFLSTFCQLVLSTFYQLVLSTCLSTFYQLFINFLTTFYQLFINFLSTVYQLFLNFLSTFYQLVLSTFYQLVLSTFYQHSINFYLLDLRRDNIHKIMCSKKGNQTDKYNLEVLFSFVTELAPAPVPAGAVIKPFSVSLCIGSSTIMACYLTTIFAMKLDLLNTTDTELLQSLAMRLLSCLVIHCMSDPKADPDQQMLEAMGEKRMALQRTPVSPYQHWYVYQRILSKKNVGRGSGAYSTHLIFRNEELV